MKKAWITTAFLCALVLVVSCSRQKRPAVPEDRSLAAAVYEQMGMPSPEKLWTPQGYSHAVRTLTAIAQKDERQLPRYNSEVSGRLFERLSSRGNLNVILNENLPPEARLRLLLGYLDGVKQALMVYSEPSTHGVVFDAEVAELTGLMLKLVQEITGTANGFIGSVPKDDPRLAARQEAFTKMKGDLVTAFDRAVNGLGETSFYRTAARIRLCGYLQDTLPLVMSEFPPAVQAEIPQRIERMQASESDEQMKRALTNLHDAITVAVVR